MANLAPFLNDFVGDSGAGGQQGLVPAPPAGSAAAGDFLNAAGVWAVPSGTGGGVTSVGAIDSQTPSANGLVIDGVILYAQSASGTMPGLLNTASQTIAGAKTFTSQIKVNGASNFLSLGTTNPTVYTSSSTTATRTFTTPDANSNSIQPLGSATTNNWVQYIGSDGIQHLAQPAFTNISGIAASAQLPTPTTSLIGGVKAINAVSHNWISSIDTTGIPQLSQPSFSDISGLVDLTTQVTGILPIANGGTALSSTPTNGQLLIGNTGTNSYNLSTLTAGAGVSISNGAGTITISASSAGVVTSLNGTVNQINVNTNTGAVIASLANTVVINSTITANTQFDVNISQATGYLARGTMNAISGGNQQAILINTSLAPTSGSTISAGIYNAPLFVSLSGQTIALGAAYIASLLTTGSAGTVSLLTGFYYDGTGTVTGTVSKMWGGYFKQPPTGATSRGALYADSMSIGSDSVAMASGNLAISGQVKTATFQMTTSPTSGYVLTSDSSGNGSWANPAIGFVTSGTGTSNQVLVNGTAGSTQTGALTFTLPQDIATASTPQFAGLGLGSALVASSILSLTSTSLGFLPPRLTTTQRNAISSPAAGLTIYNTTTLDLETYNGTSWAGASGSGVLSCTGTASQVLVNGTSGSAQTGALTLTTPQSIATTSNVQFNTLGLSATPFSNQQILAISTNTQAAASTVAYSLYINSSLGSSSASPGSNTQHVYIYPSHDNNNIGGTINTAHGVFIDQGTTAGTITNGISLQVKAPVYGVTSKIALLTDNITTYSGITPPTGGISMSGVACFGTSSFSSTTRLLVNANSGDIFALKLQGSITGDDGTEAASLFNSSTISPATTGKNAHGIYSASNINPSSTNNIPLATAVFGLVQGTIGSGSISTAASGYFQNPTLGTVKIALYSDNLSVGYTNTPPTNGLIVSGLSGFGKSSPSQAIDVTGSILSQNSGSAAYDARFRSSSGNNSITVQAGGIFGTSDVFSTASLTLGSQSSSANLSVLTLDNNGNIVTSHVVSTSGAQLKNSYPLFFQGGYWNGSGDVGFSYNLRTVIDSTSPSAHLSFQNNGGVEFFQLSMPTTNIASFSKLIGYGINTNVPFHLIEGARGTAASPTAVQSGDYLGAYSFSGYGTSTFAGSSGILAKATENFTNSAAGTQIEVTASANGSTLGLTRLVVNYAYSKLVASQWQQVQGTDIPSGAFIQAYNGNSFIVTGTSSIQCCDANNADGTEIPDGAIITFRFTSASCQIIQGGSVISTGIVFNMNGGSTYTSAANSMITFMKQNISGTKKWMEQYRAAY